ncbi:hypothetical protein U9M48_032503 [Paspalum notatum var. saurae]|uniref:non-specific serine/threonine protein kinase n=1 Tax=Paspalum notatum var. saurae TaxID=547442 RepID=A0AAQ3U641_PASNO
MRRLLLLCGLIFSLHNTPSSSVETNTLSRGRALAGLERLVSDNGKFALGFFQPGNDSSNKTVNSYLGIWFHKVPKLTPVWSANGDNPISSPAASPELMISSDGNLIILAQGTIIWSTKANITASGTVAVLLGNGNLVLRSSSNSSDIFWQSFNYPTDTLLSGAKFGHSKVTGLSNHIVSRKNLINQAPGVYSNVLGLDGTMRVSWRSSEEYWSSGKWNGRFFDLIPEMSGPTICNYTFVSNDREVYFSYTLLDESTIFQVMLDVSGQWKVRVWETDDWVTFLYEPKSQCDVYAVCGAFAVCSNNANPLCYCMKGFSVRSSKDWELGDMTGGCIRNTPLDCHGSDKDGTGMTDKFYSMTSVELPLNGIGIHNVTSAKACAQVCLDNCTCTAYSYGQQSGCSIWNDELINVATVDHGETLYLRLAAKEVQSSKRNKHKMIAVVSVGVAIVGLMFLLVIWGKRKWSRQAIDYDEGVTGIGIIAFRYVDMKRATKNFSELLGRGGFGSVFKGWLNGSIAIAVKRLNGVRQGEKQFRAELSSIGIIQHINLVKLIGFCCEGDTRLLVYEHMPNGSLDSHLFQSHGKILDWTIRYQIALGIARGLAYLHHGCRDCIMHCDVKPQNILLDTSFIPKIADFGMAKFLGREFSRVVTTTRGTIGYLAPEWISGTAITSKVDVYSYGMVLLEIVSGKMNYTEYSASHEDQEDYFPVQVGHKLPHGDILSLVDADLHGDVDMEEVERVCKVACWCIQDSEFDRPTMVEVVQFLEGICETEMPPVPSLLFLSENCLSSLPNTLSVPGSAAIDTITPGQALVSSNKLISSNGKFALGFFHAGSKSNNTLNWYLGIWYNKVPNLTQVWVANGDSPLTNLTTSELTISDNGNLVILNQATKSIVWSTKANTTTKNTVAILLNSGNLILRDSANSSEVLWQSFDYPTDTFLPGAKLGWDKGFSINSTKDWELDDRTDGCMRNIPLDCVSNKSTVSSTDKFYSIPCVRLPHNAYNIEAATSAGNSKTVCLSNCSCTAYSWGNGGCLVWYDELLNVKQQQCNDVTDPSGGTLFLRLSAKEEQSHKSSARRIMMATSLAVSFAILFSLALALMIWWNKRKMYSFTLNKSQGVSGIVPFRYTDLQHATKNFSEKLGEGGFGSVYKGFLRDSTTIAVKRLDGASQGEKQFRAEVSSIGNIQHINLVKLLGKEELT